MLMSTSIWCLAKVSVCDVHTYFILVGIRARGLAGLQPPDSDKTIIFRAKDKFFGQKPAAKMKQKCFFVFIK